MKTIQIDTKTFQMPQSWEECTPEQIQALLPLQLLQPSDRKDGASAVMKDAAAEAVLKYSAAKVLLGAPSTLLEQLTTEQKWRLMRLARWVFTTKIQAKPFEKFTFQGVDYWLPESGFSNTSAIEIAMANINYLAYVRNDLPSIRAVFQLVATLCRPARKDAQAWRKSTDFNGDIRQAYNTIHADERAKLFQAQNLPVGVVMAVLQYFEYTNNRFLENYKLAYDPAEVDEPPLYQNGEGLITTFMDIAKLGVFGDFDQVCKQNGHTVWLFLRDNNLKIRRANERAEQAAETD
ncbi:hypothetical protein LX87_05177 [Larkinella arboricola]|uniref:Uncharacterized protein n=1 Tax=Larkinella arboricola TaxID=643671 RepID=A0A327WKR0_LARAB|nr:hypothetical protein [Larkinella arboricola]RAJ92209.1 hypothetical protein LX87_05177 [Larkinella arboricola]